jgi:predicted GTPase
MTNYGKHQYYKVIDLSFKKAEEIILDEKTNMVNYYKEKYGITVTKSSQPLLEVEGRRGKKAFEGKGQILLLPEFCLMTGIP